jgi:hypothetical protein
MPPAIEPVYLPHNEPYLGQPHLLAFDQAIPDAMRANLEVARRTFVKPLSSLQIAATEIIPQDISIALSIRELIRQAYLYSAAILIRPCPVPEDEASEAHLALRNRTVQLVVRIDRRSVIPQDTNWRVTKCASVAFSREISSL